MADPFPIRRLDHLELYVGNARQAAAYYRHAFGFRATAYRGLETGCREATSYVLEGGEIRLVLTSGLAPGHAAARFAHAHGDGVAVLALEVPDAFRGFAEACRRGAAAAEEPVEERDEHGALRSAAIRAYGDTVIRFVERGGYRGAFAPGFEARAGNGPPAGAVGLAAVDHVVANVERGQMNRWVRFLAETMGFSELLHFDDEAISTEYSALMSKVMQDGAGRIKFPINEPASGRRKSQVAEYLDYFGGPGVQHVAFATDDIVDTVSRMRARGVEFLSVPAAYYDDLAARVPAVGERIGELARLGILADRDEDGHLLQVFTQPVQDRPTLFYEVIERRGSSGFGQGNFKSLFEALEREQARRGNLVEAVAS
ncbi:MAG: 4-hydroxyphenylpyruvate dioxygenase [Acidobacteria bacterium]|nr:4-hydroxyphenylpyruvate dioxygenase [Acidobacteriota bacterium]